MPFGNGTVALSDFPARREGEIAGVRLHVVPLGDLVLPSGQLEACDPFAYLGDGPVIRVAPGRYPVVVTVADVSDAQDGSHLREAYLTVVLAEGDPVIVRDLDPDRADGGWGIVGVDAGTVGFVDRAALATGMPEGDWYSDVFDTGRPDSWFALMDSPEHLVAGAANIVLPRATQGENVVLAHSGWGDGGYPLMATVDADDRILEVHIDLRVIAVAPPEVVGGAS
jgi:hypothetical protein